MSLELRTREEVIRSLIAISEALTHLLAERVDANEVDEDTGTIKPAKIEDTLGEQPPAVKARRKKERPAPAPQPEPLGPPLTNPAEMNEPLPPVKTMADIKPTKPGKTLADLRVALQDCITKHGMPGAKERLAPFAKVSDVPDSEIDATIKRLLA